MPNNYWENRLTLIARTLRGSDLSVRNQFEMYTQGLIDGVEAHAIHKNGKFICGALQTPFQEVRNEILSVSQVVAKRFF
jgi:hypothetical protein